MLEEKKPEEDRSEFESRLESIFNPMRGQPLEKCVQALILNDLSFMESFQAKKTIMDVEKAKYLAEWDAAKTKEDKMKVVGSVKGI